MLRFTCKKFLLPNRILRHTLKNLASCSSTLIREAPTPDSTATQEPKDENFTVSYLMESCGLGPEAAKCIHLGFSGKPEAQRFADRWKYVIKLFRHFGFHDYHIARLVLKQLQLFSSAPDKELKPKIELLVSLGAHPTTVAEILLNFPCGHLQDHFLPLVDFLVKMHSNGEELVETVMSFCRTLSFDPQAFLANVAVLREVGMPDNIVLYFMRKEHHILDENSILFKKIVDEVKIMRIDPQSCDFVDGMLAISAISTETYKQKSRFFKKWGWSDAELLKVLIEHPKFLDVTEKKIDEVMDCFVNTLGFKPLCVVQCPLAFTCSRKKLISRFCVAKFLWAKGVINVDSYKMSSFLETSEHLFLKRFVTKHKENVPELFDLYSLCKEDGKPFYAS
uniref:Uncharacterized protein n=1 Tax=Kalanchoe fedtschenkoi TaxID=63787 RepID=A0A7N0TTA5_KALFE